MKKFVICLFAALSAFVLAIGASAAAVNNGGVVGAAENIVGGTVNGVEEIAGGVVNGAEDLIGGTAQNHNTVTDNGLTATENRDALENARHDRNPATGVGFGMLELAAIGTTLVGTAALATRKRG
ncbi:MAG: hypothetical protein FWG44_04850 [Oscillospiraceae bacterium]|nr:hypothetical protein [Oscillospiraceae bacterium]